MTSVDRYVSELSARLQVGSHRRARIEKEVRDHLADAIERHVASGSTSAVAAAEAIAEFGPPAALASQLNVVAGTHATRRAPVAILGAGLAVPGGLVLAAATQPHPTSPAPAALVAQVAFFTAVLGFQLAAVAGACAGSRVASSWRNRGIGSDDRRFVRGAGTVSIAGLAVATVGWATAIASALHTLTHPNTTTLGLGAALMIAATLASGVLVLRPRVDAGDRTLDGAPEAGGVLMLGERAIAVVRRHPLVSCGVVAVLSAAAAMAHAETTVGRALPWGLAQASAVVIGFVVLGPTLGLRGAGPEARSSGAAAVNDPRMG